LFLGVAVAGAALGCAGLLRLPKVADRLHLLGFVSVVGGFGLLAASLASEGVTPRSCKIAALVLLNLVGGAASTHALGRALLERGDR
jgi:multisubunit Na+/H+ antiporter MnhG subunit